MRTFCLSYWGWRLASGRVAAKIAGRHLAARLHSVSLGNAYILLALFGVAPSLRTRRRKITGRHLAARLHSVSLGNAYVLLSYWVWRLASGHVAAKLPDVTWQFVCIAFL